MWNSTRTVVAVLWILSLVVVARWASAQGDPVLHTLQPPVVYAGEDVGFRVYPRAWNEQPAGRIVVRIDGEWREVQMRADASR